MAPPKKPAAERRSVQLRIRLTPDELDRIRLAAANEGESVSQWVRWWLLES